VKVLLISIKSKFNSLFVFCCQAGEGGNERKSVTSMAQCV